MDDDGVRRHARAAYESLAPVWSADTDEGPWNEGLERPAVRSLLPRDLLGQVVLDAGCATGAHAGWLLDRGAAVVACDLSPAMVAEAATRCRGRGPGTFLVADLGAPLPLADGSVDGVVCSLALHYLQDWSVPMASFHRCLRPDGWVVLSVGHPSAPALEGQSADHFATEVVADTWEKGGRAVEVRFWRRPLEAVVGAATAAGFVVDALLEPHATPADVARHPELAGWTTIPLFLVLRLIPR